MAAAVRPLAASPRRGAFFLIPVGLVVAGILAVLGVSLARGDKSVRTSMLVGHPAPAFSYTTFDGKTLDLASLKGKPVMLNFWGSWCIPCKDEAPVLAQAWQQYQSKGVQFVGVAIWDKPDAALTFAQGAGATWLNGMDNDGKIAIDYGVYGVPESYFIDKNGVLIDRFPGPFVGSDGTARLDQYLQKVIAS